MRAIAIWFFIWFYAGIAIAGDEVKISYPLVLIGGFCSFPGKLPFDKSYWGDIAEFLEHQGATVLIAEISAVNNSHVRAEQLYQQLLQWDYAKYHLIGHSQGGIDARLLEKMIPDRIASITTIGTPHRGSKVADVVYGVIEKRPVVAKIVCSLGDAVGCAIEAISHHYCDVKKEFDDITGQICHYSSNMMQQINARWLIKTARHLSHPQKILEAFNESRKALPGIFDKLCKGTAHLCRGLNAVCCRLKEQDAKSALECLTTKSLEKINHTCPLGLDKENSSPHFFSWGTYEVRRCFNNDPVSAIMYLMSWLFFTDEKNDGVVSLESMQFGTWLGDRAGPHHLIATNNGLGSFQSEDIDWFRSMFQTLLLRLKDGCEK